MPSRWWVPISGVVPGRVRLEHLHAAVSRWFDLTQAEHDAPVKPYAMSPIADGPGGVGFEVGVLTEEALGRLRAAGAVGREVRLGAQLGTVGAAAEVASEGWDVLGRPSGARAWEFEFVTPVTFRRNDRSSPWPGPGPVLRGLAESWGRFSGLSPRELSHQQADTVWVSDFDGHSELMMLGSTRVSGFLGRLTYRCDDPVVADLVDPLFRLAPYSGVGSFKAKGLGVARLLVSSATRPARRS